MYTRSSLRYALAVTALTCGACAGGDAAGDKPVEPTGPPAQMGPASDTLQPTAQSPQAPASAARELIIDGAIDRLMVFGETAELAVRYVDAQGLPMQDARITGRLLDPAGADLTATGIEGTALVAAQAQPGPDGRAVLSLRAGQVDTHFRVEAQAPNAAPVYWNIAVSRSSGGRLAIEVRPAFNVGASAVRAVRVGLYPSPACAQLGANPSMLPAAASELGTIEPFSEFDNRIQSGELAGGTTVSVAVQGLTVDGGTAAFGCVDGAEVMGGEERVITVDLTERPVDLAGPFAAEHVLDLTEVISRNSGDLLRNVANIGGGANGSRGDAVVELVCERGDLDDLVCTGLRLFGGGIIDGVISSSVDPAVLDALDAFGDLYNIVSQFSAHGELIFSGQRQGDRWTGNTNRFDALEFTWRSGCPYAHSEPARCTQRFTVEALGLRVESLSGVFDAVDVGSRQLSLSPHTVQLPMGHVALAVAETWLLPAAMEQPGPVRVGDLMARFLPCDVLDQQLAGTGLAGGICRDALVGVLEQLVLDELDALGAAIGALTFEGTAHMTDRDGDRSVDGLSDGTWSGIAAGATPFSGTFEACRPGVDCNGF